MRNRQVALFMLVLAAGGCGETPTTPSTNTKPPPFGGTIFIDPDIITDADPTTFLALNDRGVGERRMFDRRVNATITVNAYLFEATFSDFLTFEVQVNPEFGSAADARLVAEKYVGAIGRIPKALRQFVQTVWIHSGAGAFGGGNNNLLIHDGQGDLNLRDGILEETFVHEGAHTSLDGLHATHPGWLSAQTRDGVFISNYARDNPLREDVAETFVPYLAVRYRSSRISPSMAETILRTIPNRIAYLDALKLNMAPIQ